MPRGGWRSLVTVFAFCKIVIYLSSQDLRAHSFHSAALRLVLSRNEGNAHHHARNLHHNYSMGVCVCGKGWGWGGGMNLIATRNMSRGCTPDVTESNREGPGGVG
jgi:hypothetical protein